MQLLRDLCITALAGVLFLSIVELSLRMAGLNYDASFYKTDKELGYVLRPNAAGWSVQEQEKFVRINSQGLRDREHTTPRPANVIRIAVIGDSVAEAKQVDLGAAYWSVMEAELNRRLRSSGPRGEAINVEVINFGVAWYGLAQDYFTIRDRIWQYDPQIVLLSGTLASFILKSSRKYMRSDEPPTTPYFVLKNGQLVLDDITTQRQQAFVPVSHLHNVFENSMNASHLLALTNAAMKKLASEATAFLKPGPASAAARRDDQDNLDLALTGPVTLDLAQAWSVAEALIQRCQQVVSSHHAEFWLFTLDQPPQVDPKDEERALFLHKMGMTDMFQADEMLAAFAQREGIRHAMLAPSILAYAEAHHAVLHGFSNTPRNSGHWNETGHRVAGQIMAADLFGASSVIGADLQRAVISDNR